MGVSVAALLFTRDREERAMVQHHGGKVGSAAKTLASKESSKSAKSKAGKTLANHKTFKH